MTVPILIVIPFWEKDRLQALDLCRIIAGMQSEHAKTAAHVLLVNRQDCAQDNEMMKILKPKFDVFTYKANSPLRGWPAGSNGMFGSTMIHISNTARTNYECVYWMEPDAIPITPTWYMDLVGAWREKHPDALVVGCRSDCNGDGSGDHVTGCALYHPNIARLMPFLCICDNMAWDYQHRAKIVAKGGSTKLIENFYRQQECDYGILERYKLGVAIIHGIKGKSLVEHVAKKFNIKLD